MLVDEVEFDGFLLGFRAHSGGCCTTSLRIQGEPFKCQNGAVVLHSLRPWPGYLAETMWT